MTWLNKVNNCSAINSVKKIPLRQLQKSVLASLVAVVVFMVVAGGVHAATKPVKRADAHTAAASVPEAVQVTYNITDNTGCLSCHEKSKSEILVQVEEGKNRPLKAVNDENYLQSVHAKMLCVECHKEIANSGAPHKKYATKLLSCTECHQNLWETGDNKTKNPRLGIVVQNIEAYRKSFHARPNQDDPGRANATCNDCHDTHSFKVPLKGSTERTDWRLTIPTTCGPNCHSEQYDTYETSAHGKQVIEKHNPKGAVCTDCHTSHSITNTSADPFKMDVTQVCGGCHQENLRSYVNTYHGQVNSLGYTYTAKCYDCHGSHGILGSKDPASKVHPDNRLKACKECHDGKTRSLATAGFITFGPHANSHDYAKYPQVWIATKFMVALLIGVFTFFWLHSGLWYFRERQERKAHKKVAHVRTEGMQLDESKFFQRFPVGWRIAHLSFALVTMTLVLTGTAALFSNTGWASAVAHVVGGAKVLAVIHRIAAVMFVGIFLIHFVYVMQKLLRDRKFRWFGPDSLVPNWKDLADAWGMFKWFFGKGEKPLFDRWTYFEKFDYWAVFWGVTIIGFSGLMLAFPTVTATYLPGWVLNVATIVHGEEAFLAAVFLFTVHFFNNHFRPHKLPPPDIVMFTGTQSLEEFRNEHPAQYRRLVDAGELEDYLVDGPSKRMTFGSNVLGLVLIAMGLTLLTLVVIGFLSSGH